MHTHYSPQMVQLLNEELIRVAQEARRKGPRRTTSPQSRFAGLAGRLFARRTSPAASTCTC